MVADNGVNKAEVVKRIQAGFGEIENSGSCEKQNNQKSYQTERFGSMYVANSQKNKKISDSDSYCQETILGLTCGKDDSRKIERDEEIEEFDRATA